MEGTQSKTKFADRFVPLAAASKQVISRYGSAPAVPSKNGGTQTPPTNAAVPDQSFAFPKEAMYGRLAGLAEQMEMPLGLSYPALLGCFSSIPLADEMCGTRLNLYVGLIAPVGGGKNTAIGRACRMLGLKKKEDWRVTTASSDRGLMGIIGDRTEGRGATKRIVAGPTKMLLRTNEMRGTLKKAAIEGSVLADMLCEVWDSGQWECSDKSGSQACDCRLSWIGGIPVKDDSPEEFAEAFGRETSNGLMSRMMLGYAGGEKFDGSKPWKPALNEERVPDTYDPGLSGDFDFTELAPKYVVVKTISAEAQHAYDAWTNPRDLDGRLKYNLMKVALLTASANLDQEVGAECMNAAIAFIEFQCRLREVFKPSEAKDTPEAVLGEIIMDKFIKLAALGKEPIKWERVAHDMKWRKHGPSLVNRTIEGLVAMGELEYVQVNKEDRKTLLPRGSTDGRQSRKGVWVKWQK